MDLATATGQSVPKVIVEDARGGVDEAILDALEAVTFLEKVSDGKRIASKVRRVGASADGDPRGYLEVEPSVSLEDGWYLLRVSKIPDGLAEPSFPNHVRFPDGSIGVRFRPDSHPALWGIVVCSKDKGDVTVSLEFSEKLVLPKNFWELAEVRQTGGATCSIVPGQEGATNTGALVFSCSGFEPDAETVVSLGEGFSSAVGAQLAQTGRKFVSKDQPPWGEQCQLWRDTASPQ